MDIEAAGRSSGLDDFNARTPSDLVAPIYAATFSLAVVAGLDWQKTNPAAALLAEPDAQFKRRGAADDVAALDLIEHPEFVDLLRALRPLVLPYAPLSLKVAAPPVP